ncbi:hypothetical protein D3C76_1342590 [compost metagenome]
MVFSAKVNGKLFMYPSKVIQLRVGGRTNSSSPAESVAVVGLATPSDRPIAHCKVTPADFSWCKRIWFTSEGSNINPKVAAPGVARPASYVRAKSLRQVVSI